VRRFTLITLILLFVGLAIVAYLQFQAGQGERRFCGPNVPDCIPGSQAPSSGSPKR
jgi:hypothetical protein